VTIELPPVVKNVAVDTSLEPIDVRVFLVAVPQLDDVDFRELKILPIATRCEIGIARRPVVASAVLRTAT
jgi:hypothetical protein